MADLNPMNHDALSVALAQISLIIKNLSKKNLSNSSNEIVNVETKLSLFRLNHLSLVGK